MRHQLDELPAVQRHPHTGFGRLNNAKPGETSRIVGIGVIHGQRAGHCDKFDVAIRWIDVLKAAIARPQRGGIVDQAMLRQVAAFCVGRRLPAQVAVREQMACGMGLCFSCVVPVMRKDGSGFDHLRACTEGPVFNPARILWDRWDGDEMPPAAETEEVPW